MARVLRALGLAPRQVAAAPRPRALRTLGFVADGGALGLVELGERLGFDSAWVGGGDPAVLTEAARRTSRIALGAMPVADARELELLDRRSGARLHLGVGAASSAGELLRSALPGLPRRLWYDAEGPEEARWAGEQGFNLLLDSAGDRLALLRAFRAAHPDGAWARVCQRLRVIPTDSATPAQRARYADRFADRPGLVGPSGELAERLGADPAFREVEEVAVVLPDGLPPADHAQILTDLAGRLGPSLGWHPAN